MVHSSNNGLELEYAGKVIAPLPANQKVPDDMREFILHQISEKEQIRLMRDIMEVLIKKAPKKK